MLNQSIKRLQDTLLSPIKRTAFDFSGRLGSLYDACQDQPLRLLDVTFQQPSIQIHERTQCTLEECDEKHKPNPLTLIHLDEQLRLSLLLNLTAKTGIAALVDYPYIINEYTRILHYYYLHRDEQFPDEVHKIRDRLEIGLSKTNATHIITGVSWGINIVIILQLPPEKDLIKRIDNVLEKYRAYLNGDSNDFKLTREDLDANKHIIDTNIYSNIPSVTEMKTIHNVFHNISRLKADPTQHYQLSYVLYPLSNSNYVPLDSAHNEQLEQYVFPLTTSMKIIERCFNDDMPKLLRGHFTERFSNTYQQWSELKLEYTHTIDRLSKLLVDLRCGQSRSSTLDRMLSYKAKTILKNNLLDLYYNVIELNKKAHFINSLYHENIEYCNVTELNIDKNDNEHTLKHKLIVDETIDRVLCSSDSLNKKSPTLLRKLRFYLIEEFENNDKVRLIYADFSYCTYELHDMILIPSIQHDPKKKYQKSKDLSLSIDVNTSISSLPKTNKTISKSPRNTTINVLLLGETGVGKSTFINSLVNYLTFKTIDKAQSEEPIVAVPTQFRMTAGVNSQEHTITYGDVTKSAHENFQNPGQTTTQRCRSHIYHLYNADGTKLRIIDTPGFGDSRGNLQDNRNMQRILEYIKKFKYLNAICVFLKPNELKLNVYFRSCLTQLFKSLGPDVRHNMVFCFTNTRSTSYVPESTVPLLKNVISSLSMDEIPFNKKNVFCFDNESFRYLAALKNKIQFTEYEKNNYEMSWTNSTAETNRLLRYIRKKLIPYYIPDENELIRSTEIEIVQMIHPILESMRNLLRKIIRSKTNLLKVSFESDLKNIYSTEIQNPNNEKIDSYFSSSASPPTPPHQPTPIDYFEDYRISNESSSKMQNDMIDQLSLLSHITVEFAYFLLHVAHYSQSDPFLDGFLRMINEENVIFESRNRNYINAQIVESLKTLANNYKQRIEFARLNPKENCLSIISQWIKYMHGYPLITDFTIDCVRKNPRNDNKVTSI